MLSNLQKVCPFSLSFLHTSYLTFVGFYQGIVVLNILIKRHCVDILVHGINLSGSVDGE